MSDSTSILEFRRVRLEPQGHEQLAMREVDFSLAPGALALVHVTQGHEHLPLADAAGGVVAPAEGEVLFKGEDWSGLNPDRLLELRGRIGRVFDGWGFISNLNVDQNIVLAQRHHTLRPESEIRAEAEEWGRAFGFDSLPGQRPHWVPARDLKRAEWIRAFMGAPALLLLERPMTGVPEEFGPRLARAVAEARQRGAAVLWIDFDPPSVPLADLVPTCRFRMRGDRFCAE